MIMGLVLFGADGGLVVIDAGGSVEYLLISVEQTTPLMIMTIYNNTSSKVSDIAEKNKNQTERE